MSHSDRTIQRPSAAQQHLRHFHDALERFGIVYVAVLFMPLVVVFGGAAAPDRFEALQRAERPGIAAVGAGSGPETPPPAKPQPPEVVKGIYLTTSTVGWKKRFNELVDFVDRTEVNSLVIDVKDWRGNIAFTTENPVLAPYVAEHPELGDLKELTAPLKEKGIYLVARVFVFQDPAYAEARPELAVKWPDGRLWRDNKGIPWLDPASRAVWDYNIAIAKEVVAGGFDEVQFDYIRFPSDGKTSGIVYPFWDGETPKHENMRKFFVYLDRELRAKEGIRTSVDLFGFTMWFHDYDLNIGQLLADALPHFDAISPMVYPSHYPDGWHGFANPAANPGEVIALNMAKGMELVDRMRAADAEANAGNPSYEPMHLAEIRPWLQDFDLGADYTPAMLRAQIDATMDNRGSGWLFWNARNVYTESAFTGE